MASYISELATNIYDQGIHQLEDVLSSHSVDSKLSNKLQLSALVFYIKSFPFLPSLPFKWDSKEKKLIKQEGRFRTVLFLTWVVVFEFLLTVAWPCYLLFVEFLTVSQPDMDEVPIKFMGMKKSLFVILFAVGTLSSIGYGFTPLAWHAQELCYDYHQLSKFTNYIDKVHDLEAPSKKIKKKIDMIGLLSHLQVQGFVITGYFTAPLVVYFKMDAIFELFEAMFPSCVSINGNISGEPTCQALFYGARTFLVYGWASSAARSMCGAQLMAFIFFEMFNQCVDRLGELPPKLGIHHYWAYWKVTVGVRYWQSYGLAVGVYMGIWIIILTTFATIQVLPNVKPLTMVYATFPFTALVGICVFMCLPIGIRFVGDTQMLIEKWRYQVGISKKGGIRGKVMRKELNAMQPVRSQVGPFFLLDKGVVSEIFSVMIDQIVNLMVSVPI